MKHRPQAGAPFMSMSMTFCSSMAPSIPSRPGPAPRSQLRKERASVMPHTSPWNFKRLADLASRRELFTCASLTSPWPGRCGDARSIAAGDAGQLAHQHAGPPEDVVLPHVSAHARHAVAALGRGHLDGPMNGLRGALDVVGIHEQGVPKLTRRAGEPAQNQHGIVVVAGGDELLGDQVHAVVQRADDTELRGPVPRADFSVLVVAFTVHDRLPAPLA